MVSELGGWLERGGPGTFTFTVRGLRSNSGRQISLASYLALKFGFPWSECCPLGTGGFTHDELLKVWKGLFYCMWMQDKPLLQVSVPAGSRSRSSGLIGGRVDVWVTLSLIQPKTPHVVGYLRCLFFCNVQRTGVFGQSVSSTC